MIFVAVITGLALALAGFAALVGRWKYAITPLGGTVLGAVATWALYTAKAPSLGIVGAAATTSFFLIALATVALGGRIKDGDE